MALFNRAIRIFLQVALCMGIGIVPLASQGVISLVGSGSSVPSPLYNAWAMEYGKLKPTAQVRYLQMGAAEGTNPGQRHSRSTDRDAAMVGRRLRIWILRAQDAVWNDLWRIGGGDRIADLDGAVHGNYFPGRRVECRTGGKPERRAS